MKTNSIESIKDSIYKKIATALVEEGLNANELAEKINVFPQALGLSLKKKTLRLDTILQIEMVLKKKIITSMFENEQPILEILKKQIDEQNQVIKELTKKIPSAKK